MDWLGRAKLDFATAPESLPIREKGGKTTSLLEICRATVPPCQLNPLLFNGHAHTMWTATQKAAPPIHYKRRIFEADHREFNGSFAVDFVVSESEVTGTDDSLPPRTVYFSEDELAGMGSDDDRPMLVILHGLSGGSHEVYLRHAIAPLIESGKWEGCVVNSRGCAKSKITTGILYNARATWDVRQYLGEEGSACQLKAAVVCANPWDLQISNKELGRTFVGHEVYQRVLGTAMRRLSATHKEEIQKYTNVDYDHLTKLTYLHEFDRAYQCPTWGYPTETAYYRDASSVDSLLAVRIPLLAINAVDDPIASYLALPFGEARQNPYTVLCTTSLGGHLGWFEIGGGRWHGKPVTNFFNHMAFEVDLDSIKPEADGKPELGTSSTQFDPMRRKMHVDLNQGAA
ncbi:hypothetical protein DL767_006876 [Monosporascus sp. MG133]|nr:hypothetical protein DL767_006876 [Monosporascus sp. MG133]